METLKELMTPKTFNKFGFGVVIVWIVFGAILLGIFAGLENSESKLDVYCDDAKTIDKELLERKCFDQYQKEYNKFSIPVYGFVVVNFFVVAFVSVIYSQCVKSTVNQLDASNRRSSDAEGQIENGNQPRRRRRLFIAYCCQLVIRIALGILFIVLQILLLYPGNFPSNFECSLAREGNSSSYTLANFTRTQTYECRNQRVWNKTFWTVSVAVVNGTFASLVLTEFFWILSRSRKGKKFMEDSQFFADHLPKQEQQHEQNLQQIPLLRIHQQGQQERQEHRNVQHESQLQASIKSMKENIIKYTEKLVDLKQPILRDPGQGPKPKDLKIDEICVNLEIYEGRTNYKFPKDGSRWEQLRVYPKPADANQARFERPEDIIDLQNKNILVVGRPGIGKTILSTQLLRKWASGGAFNDEQNVESQFDVAFLLKFRRLNKLETNLLDLRELLTRAETVEHVDDEVWDHIIRNPTKVLLIFDGIDEMSTRSHIATEDHSDYKNNAVEEQMPLHCLYNKLASGLLLDGATVLTTTRPTAASNVKHLNFDRVVEILGFTSEKVNEYVEKFTTGDHDARANETEEAKEAMCRSLWQHISQNINLFSLCYIPVNCFIICSCLSWMILRFGRSSLPTKLTKLYSIAVRLFYFRHSDKYRSASTVNDDEKFIFGKFHELPSQVRGDFKRLGEIAFQGMQEGRLIFESTEVQGLESCGLLHQLPNDRAGLELGKTQFCFIHLTVQEFLAAKHVTDTLSQKDDLRTFVSDHIDKGTWEVVLQFVAGLLEPDPEGKVQNSDIFTELFPKDTLKRPILNRLKCGVDSEQSTLTYWPARSKEDNLLAVKLCKCLYEIDEKHFSIIQSKLAEINFNAVFFNEEHFKGPVDCAAVLHVIRNTPGILLHIRFAQNNIGPLGCREIHKFIVDSDYNNSNCELHVTSLYILLNDITDEGANYLAKALKHDNCKLNSLDLSGNKITDEGANYLAEALKDGNCKLHSLHLPLNNITAKGVKHLAEALKHGNCKLNSLDLSQCLITDEGAKHLAEALKHCNCQLDSLYLRLCNITDEGLKHLAEALKHRNCQLESLDLFRCNITDEGLKHLAEALKHGDCKLNSLDLSGYNKTDEGAKHLAEALKHDDCKLNSLNLSGFNITEKGAKHLAEALKHINCQLNSLDLSGCNITDKSGKHLAEALKHGSCQLNSLNFRRCKITEEGAKHLAEALKHGDCKLNSLDLSWCKINDEGAKHLVEALKHGSCKLNSLHLSECNITDNGAKHLAEALKHGDCQLNSLDLSGCNITDEGAKHLAEALKHGDCKLNILYLSRCDITDEGAKHLAEALKHCNCQLNSLYLARCNIADEGAKYLAEALMHSECKLNILHIFLGKITEEGKKHLAKALKHRNTERKLCDIFF